MLFQDLTQKLSKFQSFDRLPNSYFWPYNIYVSKEIWEIIKKLRKWTDSVNTEYASTILNIDNQIIATPFTKGDATSVTSFHSIQLKYVPYSQTGLKKEIYIDDKLQTISSINITQKPKKSTIQTVFNIHSHPTYINQEGQKTYSFFSPVDINTLIHTNQVMMGVVTDMFWLVCKTDKTIKTIGQNGVDMLYKISNTAFSGEKFLDNVIKQEMKDWGLVFYKAEFSKPLQKI